jgi:hypothetical protein
MTILIVSDLWLREKATFKVVFLCETWPWSRSINLQELFFMVSSSSYELIKLWKLTSILKTRRQQRKMWSQTQTLVLFQLHWVHEVNAGHIRYTPLKGANVLSPVQSSWHLEADAQHCHYASYAVKPWYCETVHYVFTVCNKVKHSRGLPRLLDSRRTQRDFAMESKTPQRAL